MPATPLPASGEPPRGPKTCDASGMVEIHRLFRRGFGEAPALVRRVSVGDTAHAAVVATQLATMSLGLHAHTHMPAPARLAWRLIGRRRYAAHRAALEGR